LEAIKNIELHVQSDSLSLDQIKVMLTELVGYLDLKSCQKLYQKCLENSKLAVLLPEIMSLIENSVDRIQLVYDARIWPLVKGNNELRKKVWQMMLKFPELFLADVLFSSNIDEEIKKAYIQNIDWLNNNTVELVNKFLAEKTDEKNMTKYARIIMNNAPKNININIPNKLLKGDLLDIFSKRIYNQQVLKMTNSEDLPDDLKNYFIKMINIFENEKPSSDSVDNFVTSFGLLVENLENSNKLKAYKFVEKYFFQDSGYLDEIQNKIHKIEMEIMIKKYNDFKINHLEKSNNVIDREVVTDEFNKLMSDDSELIDFLAGRYLSYQENNLDDPTTAKIDEFDNVILELILEKYPSDYRKIMFLARKITRSTSDKNWKVKAQFDIVEINNLMINNMDLLLHKETTNILIGQEILSIKNLAQVVDWVGENFEKISMISNCDNKTATKILQNTLRDFDQQKFLHFISAFPKAVHNSTILRKAMNYNNQAIDVAILLDIHSTDDILYLADQGEKGLTLALFLVIHKQENSLRSNIFAQLFKKHYNKHTRSFFMRVAANNPSLQIYPESFSCLTDFCPKDLFYIALKNKLVLNLKDWDIEKIGKNNYYLKRPEGGKRVVKIFNGEDSFCKIKSEDKKYYELQVILKNSSDIGVNLLDKRKLINTTVDICNNDCYLTLDEHGTVCGLEARDNNKRLGFIHRDDFPEKFLDDIRSKGYIASLNAIKLRYEKLDNDGNWIFKVTK